MGLFAELGKLFRRAEIAPPPMPAALPVRGLETPDHAETITIEQIIERADALRAGDSELWGITIAIEYRDARGAETRRRVTLRRLYHDAAGYPCINCFCHERRALRTFRFDRIISVIDADGVVWPPKDFFTQELHAQPVELENSIDVAVASALAAAEKRQHAKITAPAAPGIAQRRAARDGLRVLVALARADGEFDDAEMRIILDYIAAAAMRAGITTVDADRRALTTYLRHQRPAPDLLNECLDRLERAPAAERHALTEAAAAIVACDPAAAAEEIALLRAIEDHFGKASKQAR